MGEKVKEFVIASDCPFDDPLEMTLYNLKIRLMLQEKWVENTKSQIRSIEEELSYRDED